MRCGSIVDGAEPRTCSTIASERCCRRRRSSSSGRSGYVVRNPVEAGLCSSPFDARWSELRCHRRSRRCSRVPPRGEILDHFGRRAGERSAALRRVRRSARLPTMRAKLATRFAKLRGEPRDRFLSLPDAPVESLVHTLAHVALDDRVVSDTGPTVPPCRQPRIAAPATRRPSPRRRRTTSGCGGRRPCGAPRPARRRSARRGPASHIAASGVSSVSPRAPCTWIARSITSHEHPRGVELEQRDLDARLRALVDLPRGVHRQQAAGLDLGRRVGDPVLHRLLLGERPAERLPLVRVRGTSARTRAASARASASRGGSAPGPSRFCASRNAVPLAAERVRDGHPHARVPHLAVRAPAAARVPHHRDRRGRPRRRACRPGRGSSSRAGAAPPSGSVIANTIANAGPVRAAREPLVPVDHPLVPVPHGPRPQQRRIRARRPRARSSRRTSAPRPATSGRRKRSFWSSVPNRWRISALPGVRRLAAEHELRIRRAADLLVEARVVEEPEPGPARLGRHVRRPQARPRARVRAAPSSSACAASSSRPIAASFG